MAVQALERARDAIRARAWQDAFDLFTEADEVEPLGLDDLEHLAVAAGLLQRIDDKISITSRLYNAVIDADPARAARAAFWAGLQLMNNGDAARGGGWLGRAGAALEAVGAECVEAGLMLIPKGMRALDEGDAATAVEAFTAAGALAERFRDADLRALAHLGLGHAKIEMDATDDGLAELDLAMVGVTAGEVSAPVTGIVYCAVILACRDAFDLRRAEEWTAALDTWSAAQRGLVPFRGQCLVHRSELLLLRGSWDEARVEAGRARERLGDPPGQPAIGMAFYQLGELHRVAGAFDEAEQAYRDANRHGHPPQPGLGLLLLARGDARAALATLTTALDGHADVGNRCRVLAAVIEAGLACGDVERARAACDALRDATKHRTPLLDAIVDYGEGAVLEASGDAREALTVLRRSLAAWQLLNVPYEAARARTLIARACRALGDDATADLELDAARETFAALGAGPALAALGGATDERPGGLTPREVEILRLVATGMTNRAIAGELVISEKTVARHLSNMFTKLDLSSRAEATAYAFKHGLA